MALTDGLVSYWKLDETSGTTASDSVGSNDWTASNVSWVTGKINNWWSFNGTSSIINTSYTRTNTFTVSAWIKTSATVTAWTAPTILNADNTTTNRAWQFRLLDTHKVQLQIAVLPQRNVTSTTSVDDWNRHLVTATADWTNIKVYVDGDLENTTADSSTYPTAWWLAIGAMLWWASVYWFNGLLDEVWIRERALTSTEVSELYNSWAWKQYPFTAGTYKIYLWATQLQSFKLGSTNIQKIYLWSTEVFSK